MRAFIGSVLAVLSVCFVIATNVIARQERRDERTLVAVFAHPDDETMAGPLLARYAQEPGTKVYLVIATNGENGVMPFAGIPAGAALATARTREAECAAAAFGARPPMLLGFPDGDFDQSAMLAHLASKLEETLRSLQPDAIVTWGPEGGYGHADHRLVSAVTTQIVQAGGVTSNLLYASLPKSGLRPELLAGLRFPAPFRPVADEFLNVRVPYSPADAARARRALSCHASQFTPQTMDQLTTLSHQINGGTMYLRSWSGGAPRSSVFVN